MSNPTIPINVVNSAVYVITKIFQQKRKLFPFEKPNTKKFETKIPNRKKSTIKINTKMLTVTCPLGVSGDSQVITIVDELNVRTCTFLGALSISAK